MQDIRALNRRQFDSAKFDNIFSGWTGTNSTPDEELRGALPTIRARTRSVCQNSEYARKFLAMTKQNVIGPKGIKFQAKTRRSDGSLDRVDNDYLESSFFEWAINKDFCSIDGRQDWIGIQNLAMETLARDGECFIRLMRGDEDNPFGLSLWVLEGDAIPINHNIQTKNQEYIVMGIEQNQFGRPLAYYQQVRTPTEQYNYQFDSKTERVPASEMIHLFMQERPAQSRGIPWMQSAIRPLEMLNSYSESELVASRIGSSSMGFFKSPGADSYSGTAEDSDGNLITEFAPGQFQQLPAGMEFQSFDPQHPTTAFGDFVKSILRSVANGCLVSYNALANDLESVNYSSLRAGAREEQSHWKSVQEFFISGFMYPVYREWVRMGITTGRLQLPMSKLRKFEEVKFIGRGWEWVDPEKELKAKKLALEMGTTSLSEIAAEQGKEWTDVLAQLTAEKDVAAGLGLTLTQPVSDPPTETIEVEDNRSEEIEEIQT